MDRFLVIDGSNLLFQMFFGMPGKAIQGTLGFVGGLLNVILSFDSDFFQLIPY